MPAAPRRGGHLIVCGDGPLSYRITEELTSRPADRRRTIVRIVPAQSALVEQWLDGAAGPLARVVS